MSGLDPTPSSYFDFVKNNVAPEVKGYDGSPKLKAFILFIQTIGKIISGGTAAYNEFKARLADKSFPQVKNIDATAKTIFKPVSQEIEELSRESSSVDLIRPSLASPNVELKAAPSPQEILSACRDYLKKNGMKVHFLLERGTLGHINIKAFDAIRDAIKNNKDLLNKEPKDLASDFEVDKDMLLKILSKLVLDEYKHTDLAIDATHVEPLKQFVADFNVRREKNTDYLKSGLFHAIKDGLTARDKKTEGEISKIVAEGKSDFLKIYSALYRQKNDHEPISLFTNKIVRLYENLYNVSDSQLDAEISKLDKEVISDTESGSSSSRSLNAALGNIRLKRAEIQRLRHLETPLIVEVKEALASIMKVIRERAPKGFEISESEVEQLITPLFQAREPGKEVSIMQIYEKVDALIDAKIPKIDRDTKTVEASFKDKFAEIPENSRAKLKDIALLLNQACTTHVDQTWAQPDVLAKYLSPFPFGEGSEEVMIYVISHAKTLFS